VCGWKYATGIVYRWERASRKQTERQRDGDERLDDLGNNQAEPSKANTQTGGRKMGTVDIVDMYLLTLMNFPPSTWSGL
jgi:hypothetical protein